MGKVLKMVKEISFVSYKKVSLQHKNTKSMLPTLLITLFIVAVALVLLCVKLLLVKGGKFPNTHVGGNKAMQRKGIHCVKAQDREARLKKKLTDIITE